jgi:hypothetical protein
MSAKTTSHQDTPTTTCPNMLTIIILINAATIILSLWFCWDKHYAKIVEYTTTWYCFPPQLLQEDKCGLSAVYVVYLGDQILRVLGLRDQVYTCTIVEGRLYYLEYIKLKYRYVIDLRTWLFLDPKKWTRWPHDRPTCMPCALVNSHFLHACESNIQSRVW